MKRLMMLPALLPVLVVGACGGDEPGRLPHSEEPANVTVSEARRTTARETFPATVASERTAEIATRMSGTVDAVLVDVGARVRRGQALVELDAQDVRARVSAAAAQARLAEQSYRRVAALAADGAASQQELDQATASLEAARAALEEAEAQQAYAVVRAPFSGVVTTRRVDPGDLALPGHPLLTLVAPGALKAVAELPAQRAGSVRKGGSVTVEIPDADLAVEATVTRVVPALGPGSRTFRVEATLADAPEGVIPGAYARLAVERAGEGSRWLPADAVVRRGQLRGVYALESDTLRLRWVRLGRGRGSSVELLAGPSGDLTVVRRPAADLHDGRPVGRVRREAWSVSTAGPGQGVASAAATDGPSASASSGGEDR